MAEKMTLEQVRDTLREESKFQHATSHHVTCMMLDKLADAIDAHLAQPAQAVDVLEGDELAEFAEAVKDDRQRLPKGWRIEVREAMGLQPGLCVLGPVGAFAVDRDTMHNSAREVGE